MYPWIIANTNQTISNKKMCLYDYASYSSLQSDWLAYQKSKKFIQYECDDRYVTVTDLTLDIATNKQ